MMEKLAIAKSRVAGNRTVISVTRYGNVMASRGSVIPLFIQQIQNNEPITITDPNMTRFMMTIDDAVDLVVYAFINGSPGDTFVQKAPSCTIRTLAEAVNKLLKSNTHINIIGTRHGEKLYETLLTREEMTIAQDLGDYYRIPADNRDLNYASYFSEGSEEVTEQTDYNSHNVKLKNVDEMAELLLKLNCIQQAVRGEKVGV
jgi:UDP-glucose 4-epimerase